MNLGELVINGDFCPYPRNIRLELNLIDFYNKIASEQKDIPPEFEKTFRKNYKKLLAKF